MTAHDSPFFDVLIVGAGPVGLCMAQTLSGCGLRIAVVEQQPESAMAQPAFDGREIALTQRSAQTIRRLGLWERIAALHPHAFSALRDAQVLNGSDTFAMVIGHELSACQELGWLVSNHLIRQAAWQCVQASIHTHQDITLLCGQKIQAVWSDTRSAWLKLATGQTVQAGLMLAADSRFSSTRQAMGIAADMHDFGRSMLVCVMTHEQPHHHVAWEWFDYGQTLALLPMNDDPATGQHRASVVLTLPGHAIAAMAELDAAAFNADMGRRFAGRLGAMQLASTRHVYPLVGVLPRRLVAPRFACLGDAAVGMHPVTAHGFNLGLLGADTLGHAIVAAHRAGQDIGSAQLLHRWQRQHLLATRPLYHITQALATLYTAETPAARLARHAALRAGQYFTPFKRAVAASLTGLHRP